MYKRNEGERINQRLKTFNLIITYFQTWNILSQDYDHSNLNFAEIITEFENLRSGNSEDLQLVKFNEALSSTGYSEDRMERRLNILMNYILMHYPLTPLDVKRVTEQQKLAIWEKANHRCEWEENGRRCEETFANFREADADHITKWSIGGETTVKMEGCCALT